MISTHHEHDIDDLRTVPLIAFRLRAPESEAGIWSPGLQRRRWTPPVRPAAAVDPGSKFTLSSPFAPTAGFRCAKG